MTMSAKEGLGSLTQLIADMYKGFLAQDINPDAAMELTKHFITTLVINQKQEMTNMFTITPNNA
jgi:hypothetical protein